jgi:hypothetical protein
MATENSSHDPQFTAFTFLSGTTLTSLFFLIQTDSKNVFLLTLFGVASMLFIVATIGRLNVTTGRIPKGSRYSNVLSGMVIIGLGILLTSIGLIVFDFNAISGVIVIIVLLLSLYIVESLARKSKRHSNESL